MHEPIYVPTTVYVVYVASSPEKVWAALTSPELTKLYFFGRRVDSDWAIGSTVRYWMDDGRLDVQGRVLASEPARMLAFTWHIESFEELRHLPEARVNFRIEPLGEVTRVTVTEAHLETADEKLLEVGRRGWPVIMSGLKTLLEVGRPLPSFTSFTDSVAAAGASSATARA